MVNDDNFWDIDVNPPKTYLPKSTEQINAVEIKFPDIYADEPEKKTASVYGKYTNIKIPDVLQNKIKNTIQPQTMPKPKIISYEPEYANIINCTVENWTSGYMLYKDFYSDAKKYYSKTCSSAEHIYFFSFRSQYKELNHSQLCWYLYWRANVRNGLYIKTGLSYIFLYLYELINLHDIAGVDTVYNQILGIWEHYRDEFPRLDKYIAEWLIDLSLINKFTINTEDIPFVNEIINITAFPEIFIGEDFFTNNANIPVIIDTMSMYDYKKSKFYPERKESFDSIIGDILYLALQSKEFNDILTDANTIFSKTIRESFNGSVCCYNKKKRIVVEYKSIFKNLNIKKFITEVIRASENVVREATKVKSRLNSVTISPEIAGIINAYKSEKFPQTQKKSKSHKNTAEAEPEEVYEFNADITNAALIEQRSWTVTKTLVELQENAAAGDIIPAIPDSDNDDDNDDDNDNDNDDDNDDERKQNSDVGHESTFHVNDESPPNTESGSLYDRLDDTEKEFTAILIAQDTAKLNEFSHKYNIMNETVIDSINDKAVSIIGDIVIEPSAFEIIEDYIDLLKV